MGMTRKQLLKLKKLVGDEEFSKLPQAKELKKLERGALRKAPVRRRRSVKSGLGVTQALKEEWAIGKWPITNKVINKNILALDPSIGSFGWACIQRVNPGTQREYFVADCGHRKFSTSQQAPLHHRLLEVRNWVHTLFTVVRPDVIVRERMFIPPKVRASGAGTLFKVEGIIEVEIADRRWIEYDPDVHLIAPRALKLFATGDGKASKEDMIKAANDLWPTQQGGEITNPDEADALCLLAYAQVTFAKVSNK